MKHSLARKLTLIGSAVLVALLLVACPSNSGPNGNPGTPEYTEEQLNDATQEMMTDLETMTKAAENSRGFDALNSLPPGLDFQVAPIVSLLDSFLEPQTAGDLLGTLNHTEEDLPRGNYTYDEGTGTWTSSPNAAGNLEIRWTFFDDQSGTTQPVELIIDWDVVGKTVPVAGGVIVEPTFPGAPNPPSDPEFIIVEAPTDMNLAMTVGDNQLANIDLDATWYEPNENACPERLLEPTSLALKGFVGDSSGKIEADASLSISDSSSDKIATKGTVTATAGADSTSLNWDISMSGTITRDPCFLSDFEVSSGSLSFGIATTVSGESNSFQFAMDFDNIVTGTYGEFQSVDLSNGSITIDGTTAVTFEGTLDDANGDGYPGEKVILTFADGTTTDLATFIKNNNSLLGNLGEMALTSLMN